MSWCFGWIDDDQSSNVYLNIPRCFAISNIWITHIQQSNPLTIKLIILSYQSSSLYHQRNLLLFLFPSLSLFLRPLPLFIFFFNVICVARVHHHQLNIVYERQKMNIFKTICSSSPSPHLLFTSLITLFFVFLPLQYSSAVRNYNALGNVDISKKISSENCILCTKQHHRQRRRQPQQ